MRARWLPNRVPSGSSHFEVGERGFAFRRRSLGGGGGSYRSFCIRKPAEGRALLCHCSPRCERSLTLPRPDSGPAHSRQRVQALPSGVHTSRQARRFSERRSLFARQRTANGILSHRRDRILAEAARHSGGPAFSACVVARNPEDARREERGECRRVRLRRGGEGHHHGADGQLGVMPARYPGRVLHGLLGEANGSPKDDIRLRESTIVEKPLSKAMMRSFADSWRISQPQSVFSYELGSDTTTHTDLSFPVAVLGEIAAERRVRVEDHPRLRR
jgi:hypothetical protein